jgi:hypothetical protein
LVLRVTQVIQVLAGHGVKQDRKDLKDPRDLLVLSDLQEQLALDSFPISLEERVS